MTDSPFPADLLPCIEEFFASEHTRAPGQDIYQDVFDTVRMFPLQRQSELAAMMRISRRTQPRTVYEIGADKGGGLYHWCKSLPTVERVIACEIRGTPYRHLFEQAFPQIRFHWIEGSSYDPAAVAGVREFLQGEPLDCLFIDGDKLGFLRDFEAYRPLMNPAGVMFMHDVQDEHPRRAFEAAREMVARAETAIDLTDTRAALDREAAGIPASGSHEGWLRHWRGASCGVGVLYLGDRQ